MAQVPPLSTCDAELPTREGNRNEHFWRFEAQDSCVQLDALHTQPMSGKAPTRWRGNGYNTWAEIAAPAGGRRWPHRSAGDAAVAMRRKDN